MATDFKLPELGENVHGGDVLRVLVKAGDSVKTDQPVIELETDKATIEVPSSVDGTVAEIKVKAGEKVTVGQTIFTVSGNGTATEAKAPESTSAAEAATVEKAESREPKAESREPKAESRKPEAVPAPMARHPEDEIVDAPKPRRGEVVDIGRGSRPAAQSA